MVLCMLGFQSREDYCIRERLHHPDLSRGTLNLIQMSKKARSGEDLEVIQQLRSSHESHTEHLHKYGLVSVKTNSIALRLIGLAINHWQ